MPDHLPFFRRRTLLLCLAAALSLSLIAPFGYGAEDGPGKSGEAQEDRVTLVVDYGDGVQKRICRPWKAKMTVHDVLVAASEHPRGIKLKSRGKGETLFITAIDDCENEGSGRNWTYRVNDKSATKSSGIAELAAGDVVLWKFAGSR